MEESPGGVAAPRQKVRFGTVVSDKMQKTIVVAVETTTRHRLYKKTLKRTKRYKVHDEHNECRLGDRVRIIETRPLSKEKHWRLAGILVRGDVADIQPRVIGSELLEPEHASEETEEDSAESDGETEAEA